jgi:anion-transporting  ArsA/GET3 family ATPase
VTGVLEVLEHRPVVVVCGAGGVGKTTVSAAIAVGLARRGARVCVVTVDPARRLAGALGIDTPSDVPVAVAGEWTGALDAVQLHAASTFDALIVRHATSEAQADAIRRNPLYRSLASALGGTQEYMAMERLYELHQSDAYDVVVVDTPPTRSALELLDAPDRLLRFLSHRVVRALLAPTRLSLRAAGAATTAFLRAISAVVGGELVDDAVTFFQAFAGMQEGFAERAGAVQRLLVDPATAYVLVTTPAADALEEASWFTTHLRARGVVPTAAVVNRCHPRMAGSDPATWPAVDGVAGDQLAVLAALERAATHDHEMVAAIRALSGGAAVGAVALAPTPARDVVGLAGVADQLDGPATQPAS